MRHEMFNKILIANRGEIAVRIIRTCKRLNIATVAVYSDADRHSLHRQTADESVHIGGASARESYLDANKLVEAAIATGCQAVHPGYGFLSENAQFARQIAAAGLVFIGPPAEVIALMGDKIAAKELAISACVPVLPGHMDALKDEDEALAIAECMGYPILLKPASGGGGKGMRVVRNPSEMESALAASRQETRKSFGDNRIFIERYIENPRHIEVQIMADAHGHVIHLGERECSIQRRYQKIIEESPSPALTAELRLKIFQSSCDLARKAGYVNAGTIEYVMDSYGSFYFLEMNTRLQVEHPVTEAVTGLDIVELQLRVAAGQPLPLKQEDISLSGWAIEARICAEDPARFFMPATGMITRYAEPRGHNIRVDSCVAMGSKIGIHYDSLLSKVIGSGKTREDARISLIEALNGYHIEGVVTNIDFVNAILCHQAFAHGNLNTGFIDQYFEGGKSKSPPDSEHLALTALTATLIYHVRVIAVRESLRPMTSTIGRNNPATKPYRYKVKSAEDVFDVRLNGTLKESCWMFQVNGRDYDIETPRFELYRRRLKLIINGQTHRFRLQIQESFMHVAFNGVTRLFEIYTPREYFLMHYMPQRTEKAADNIVVCPMPGLVVEVLVHKGEWVFRGQNLVILESMKMESGVASHMDGVIAEVFAVAGQAVEAGEMMMRIEAK